MRNVFEVKQSRSFLVHGEEHHEVTVEIRIGGTPKAITVPCDRHWPAGATVVIEVREQGEDDADARWT